MIEYFVVSCVNCGTVDVKVSYNWSLELESLFLEKFFSSFCLLQQPQMAHCTHRSDAGLVTPVDNSKKIAFGRIAVLITMPIIETADNIRLLGRDESSNFVSKQMTALLESTGME